MRLAHSLKNPDIGDLHAAVTLVAKGTRWSASVNTQYNPVFGVINFAHDAQSGLLNLSTAALAGREREVASGVLPSAAASPGSFPAARLAWLTCSANEHVPRTCTRVPLSNAVWLVAGVEVGLSQAKRTVDAGHRSVRCLST